MKYFKNITLPFLIALFALTAFAQSPNTLKQKCPNVSLYAIVQITQLGDINVQPCTGRTTTFTQNVVLPSGTVIAGGLFKANNGSAGAPSYSFVNSPTTGFYRAAADTIGVSTAGAENTLFSAAVNSQRSASYTFQNVAANAEFAIGITPSSTVGSIIAGDCATTPTTCLKLTQSTDVIQLGNANTATGVTTIDATGVKSQSLQRTITAAGTTGNQTISKQAGTVNLAAANASIVVTNTTVTTSSIVTGVIRTADATCTFIKSIVPTANTITITLNANCTAETSVGFVVWN